MARLRPIEQVRNIGIMAHIDAGKTTTTERLLLYTGVSRLLGEVDDGSATMDWMVQEQERGITITAAATTCFWRDCQINVIDTPGHVDFTVEVERALRVLDGGVALLCGVRGVESQTETVWRQAERYNVPRVAFVNKMDRPGAALDHVLDAMRTRLGATPVAIQIPIGEAAEFNGVVDLVGWRALTWGKDALGHLVEVSEVPEILREEAEMARQRMIEAVADGDDVVLGAYVDGSLDEALLRAALRRATLSGRLTPVLCGASRRNKGVQPLLDAIVDYLPSPADRSVDTDGPLSALAFKVSTDRQGSLTYLRVYSGVARKGDIVLNATRGVRERLGELVRMHANHRREIDAIFAGDIGAAVDLEATVTGDTLTDPAVPTLLPGMSFPAPVMRVPLFPNTDADAAALPRAAARYALEDPSLAIETDIETGNLVLAGMGELHLEIVCDRLRRDSGLGFKPGRPTVAFRESITSAQRAITTVKKSERHQFAELDLSIEPLPRGTGIRIAGDAPTITSAHAAAAVQGCRQALDRGVFGFPVTDVAVTIHGATEHPVDSSPRAFASAAETGIRDLLATAGAELLEPVMALELIISDGHLGDVLADLSARQATITDMTARASAHGVDSARRIDHEVHAEAPLRTLDAYATHLRSKSQGRATVSMQFSRFDPVPKGVAEALRLGSRS